MRLNLPITVFSCFRYHQYYQCSVHSMTCPCFVKWQNCSCQERQFYHIFRSHYMLLKFDVQLQVSWYLHLVTHTHTHTFSLSLSRSIFLSLSIFLPLQPSLLLSLLRESWNFRMPSAGHKQRRITNCLATSVAECHFVSRITRSTHSTFLANPEALAVEAPTVAALGLSREGWVCVRQLAKACHTANWNVECAGNGSRQRTRRNDSKSAAKTLWGKCCPDVTIF